MKLNWNGIGFFYSNELKQKRCYSLVIQLACLVLPRALFSIDAFLKSPNLQDLSWKQTLLQRKASHSRSIQGGRKQVVSPIALLTSWKQHYTHNNYMADPVPSKPPIHTNNYIRCKGEKNVLCKIFNKSVWLRTIVLKCFL